MTTNLRMPQVEYTPAESRPRHNGVQHVYRFPNGYGASVISHEYSYGGPAGLWELAVLQGEELTYDTPITDDVLGHLTDEDVAELLVKVAAL